MSAGLLREPELRRQYADDFVRRAADDQRLTERLLGAAEPALPIPYERITVGARPVDPSASLNVRPSSGCTPRSTATRTSP